MGKSTIVVYGLFLCDAAHQKLQKSANVSQSYSKHHTGPVLLETWCTLCRTAGTPDIIGRNLPDSTGHQTTLKLPPHSTFVYALPEENRTIKVQGMPKKWPTCFCHNFIKSLPNLTNFGTRIAKRIQKCKLHSMSTLRSLCQRTTM